MAVYKTRRPTRTVHVRWGQNDVTIGGMSPVRVQSMTNTATADVEASVNQVLALSRAGSELVRLTVNTPEAARAVVRIREKLDAAGCDVPLVGDFHYNGHKLLTEVGECAQALSKYRINPGNVGKGERGMENFARMIEVALRYEKPVRIGVNGGSLDPEILADCEIEGCSCLEQCKVGGGQAPFVEINGKIYDGVTQDVFCKLLREAVKE